MPTPIGLLSAISDPEKALTLRLADAVELHICADVFRKLDDAWYIVRICAQVFRTPFGSSLAQLGPVDYLEIVDWGFL